MTSGTRRRVGTALIIEDNQTLMSTLEALLDDEGYTTRTARTIGGARERLSPRPDVIILDLTLADGFADELLADLVTEKLPIVIVSTHPRAPAIAEQHGVELVKKPFELGSLLDALGRARDHTGPLRAVRP